MRAAPAELADLVEEVGGIPVTVWPGQEALAEAAVVVEVEVAGLAAMAAAAAGT